MPSFSQSAPSERSQPQKPALEIVGQSAAICRVMQHLETVAQTDATVLILGETGTGKELVASAIHERSGRSGNPLVVLNCAALPANLLESELFGHERGAFTGAEARRVGRFELAHGGTMFLDEIGEMALDLQPRLLRVLQEREYERLGSSRTHFTDVRMIAATHRDLGAMSSAREFREDLYYRLNVFPITVPALRHRREDIPLLVEHFVEKFAQKMDKALPTLSSSTLSALCAHDWPGNVRELQNVIERAMILDTGRGFEVRFDTRSPAATRRSDEARVDVASASLAAVNRAHIERVLLDTNGVVAGPRGAAARLGMKRSTLVFRMKKLGIPHGLGCRGYDPAPLRSAANSH